MSPGIVETAGVYLNEQGGTMDGSTNSHLDHDQKYIVSAKPSVICKSLYLASPRPLNGQLILWSA